LLQLIYLPTSNSISLSTSVLTWAWSQVVCH